MSDLKSPLPRTGNTAPIAPPRPTTGPIRPAAAAPPRAPQDRNGVAERQDPLDRAPRPVDLGDLARTAGQLGQALEYAAPAVDAAANTADAVAFSPEALEAAFSKLKPATAAGEAKLARAVEGATKAGRVLGAVGAAIAAKDLVQSLYPKLDVSGAAEALCNLALGIATAGDDLLKTPGANAALRTVGGVMGLASSLFCLARDVMDMRENGASPTNILGLIGNGITAAGSVMLLIPGLQVIGGATLAVGAAVNVARLAVENWDSIKAVAKSTAGRVEGWLGPVRQAVNVREGPLSPIPPPRALA